MPLCLGIPKEIEAGERRVALVPAIAERFLALGVTIRVEKGAGSGSHIPDSAYENVEFVDSAEALYAGSELILKIQPPTESEIAQMTEGSALVGMLSPHRYPQRVAQLRDRSITSFSMELVPRISRAQSMDVLSSQAAVAGYKGAVMAADLCSGFFPMLTTAAGTIRPAKVLVIGAGVAGLQAIATAKRLGAIVEGYDVRGATREQVESLGARFVDTGVSADGTGGYARELTDDEKKQQQEVLDTHIAACDAVITTAALPGRPSPRIISAAVVDTMKTGAVIIDLAAEGGGNCEVSIPGERIEHNGVIVYAPLNVPSQLPVHASEMYARNLLNFLTPMIEDGEFRPDWEDEIVRDSALTRDGQICHQSTRELVEGSTS